MTKRKIVHVAALWLIILFVFPLLVKMSVLLIGGTPDTAISAALVVLLLGVLLGLILTTLLSMESF